MTPPSLKKITVVDVDLPSEDGLRFTRIHGNAESVCFTTTDHEGGNEDGFEVTWEAIYQACQEAMK